MVRSRSEYYTSMSVMVGQTQRHTKPQFLSDLMSDRKTKFSPTLYKRDNPVSMTRRIQNARPCVEKMQFVFFVPPNNRQELGFCVPLCLSHHFFVILYITCHILFLYRTECKITYSHDH
jgi:hypothetical protein